MPGMGRWSRPGLICGPFFLTLVRASVLVGLRGGGLGGWWFWGPVDGLHAWLVGSPFIIWPVTRKRGIQADRCWLGDRLFVAVGTSGALRGVIGYRLCTVPGAGYSSPVTVWWSGVFCCMH